MACRPRRLPPRRGECGPALAQVRVLFAGGSACERAIRARRAGLQCEDARAARRLPSFVVAPSPWPAVPDELP